MRQIEINDHGQPTDPRINFAHRLDRGIHEMLGLCKGILADGIVVETEARYLNDWVHVNPELAVAWPIDVLTRRLRKIFADGRVDAEERADLADLLAEIAGGRVNVMVGEHAVSTLPLDTPPPEMTIPGRSYVFTGKFAFGPRQICEDVTHTKGGFCMSRLTSKTDYLVIGTFGSTHWAHTSFGRKIMQAVALKEKGAAIKIVSEDHWVNFV